MSVLVSFFSHVAACGVVVAAFGVVPAGFRVDILPNFAPGRRGLSVFSLTASEGNSLIRPKADVCVLEDTARCPLSYSKAFG